MPEGATRFGFGFRPSRDPGHNWGSGFGRPGPRGGIWVRVAAVQGPGAESGFGFRPSGAENAAWMDKRRGDVSPMDKRRGNVSSSDTPRRDQGSGFVHQEPRSATRCGFRPSRAPSRKPGSGFGHRTSQSATRVRVSSIRSPRAKLGFGLRPSRVPRRNSGSSPGRPGNSGSGSVRLGPKKPPGWTNDAVRFRQHTEQRGGLLPVDGATRKLPADKRNGAEAPHRRLETAAKLWSASAVALQQTPTVHHCHTKRRSRRTEPPRNTR